MYEGPKPLARFHLAKVASRTKECQRDGSKPGWMVPIWKTSFLRSSDSAFLARQHLISPAGLIRLLALGSSPAAREPY